MPVTDQIKRYGIGGIGYPVGPVNLRKPLSGSIPAELSRLSGGYALVDRWEVTTGSGLSAGDYTFRVGPYSERGFKSTHRALGDISVFLQAGGVANPLAPVSCLGRKRPTGSDKGISLGTFTAAEGDRMWVVVERKDFSTLKYQIEVEVELEPPDPGPEPPELRVARIVVIGIPYAALGIADTGAVQSQADPFATNSDNYGVNTVIYSPNVAESGPVVPGFIVKGGGKITRDESAGDNDRHSYVDVRVYDLNGNFIRKNSYRGFSPLTSLYSYEYNRQSIKISGDRIFSFLDRQNFPLSDWQLCDLDGTTPSLISLSIAGFVRDMARNLISENIYIASDSLTRNYVTRLNSDLTPAWQYWLAAASPLSQLYLNRLYSGTFSGAERAFLSGSLVDASGPAFNKRSRMVLIALDSSGTVLNSWKYENANTWPSPLAPVADNRIAFSHINGITIDPVDNTLIVAGETTCPSLDSGGTNVNNSVFVARIDPTNGDVISAKVLGFTLSNYTSFSGFRSAGLVVDSDRSIYITYTPYFGAASGLAPTNGFLCAVFKVSSSFAYQGGINITQTVEGGTTNGNMEIAGDKLLVSTISDESSPCNGNVIIIDKAGLNVGTVGNYWVEGVAGGPGYYIRDFGSTVQMIDLTLTKAEFTPTRTAEALTSGTPVLTSSPKDPGSVIHTKITAAPAPAGLLAGANTGRGSLVGVISLINVSAITYSQSSIFTANTAATNATMTNGVYAEATSTGTDGEISGIEFVKMDLQAVYAVTSVVVGCDWDSALAGDWGPSYTGGLAVQYSTDDIAWTTAFTTPSSFTSPIMIFPVSFSARYIRIAELAGFYMAVTEFYAT